MVILLPEIANSFGSELFLRQGKSDSVEQASVLTGVFTPQLRRMMTDQTAAAKAGQSFNTFLLPSRKRNGNHSAN